MTRDHPVGGDHETFAHGPRLDLLTLVATEPRDFPR